MRHRLLASLALAALLAPACAEAEGTATIEVGHNRVEPASVTIQAGESVTFHNRDAMPGGHTIVAEDGSFRSPPLAKDQTWSHRFEAPGTHAFRIEQHPDAEGTVVVE